MTLSRWRKPLGAVLTLILGCLGLFALHKLLGEISFREARAAFHGIPAWRLGTAIGLTALSYLFLTLYDVTALRIVGRRVPYRTAGLASFTSYALSHNLGLGLLTGGTARYRIYSSGGVGGADVARIIGLAGMTFWLGLVVMTGLALAANPDAPQLGGLPLPGFLVRGLGFAVLAAVAAALFAVRHSGRVISVAGWTMPMPSARQALGQIVVACCDMAAASAALFVLVPGIGLSLFPVLFLAYVLAVVIALISHVPGGIGVFEAVILALLPQVERPELLGALIAYRVIYYLLPLVIAAAVLAIQEHRQWRGSVGSILGHSQVVATSLSPILLSMLTFGGGAMLLVSGALPGLHDRLQILRRVLPLPFTEASHIAASLSGTALLLLAPGLYQRQDGAFHLARIILLAGAAFSLLKGLDYEEAIVLLVIAGLLQWTRAAFYRRSSLTSASLSRDWLVAVALALGLSFWIGLFAYKHVAYQSELWWDFAWRGNAPRFLRASFASSVLLTAAALHWLFRTREVVDEASLRALPEATEPLALSDRTYAALAYCGDKRFLVSSEGDAFVMYQVQGQSWIVMGDPVGNRDSWSELLWRLRDLCDRSQGRLLLYQLSDRALPLAIDLGLQLIKYGEDARVDLDRFSLDVSEARSLRYSERRARREGAIFEIVPAAQVPSILGDLEVVSKAWLRAKGQAEKAFSIGAFDRQYMSKFDCAVVRQEGRIVAFANIWKTDDRGELSVDLMRHADEMPYGTMDFLFIHLMLWGRQNGYRWFNLGLAPLSGIEAGRLAPVWARLGHLLYKHGEAQYGFEGLRAYKEKFLPCWDSSYIAGPPGIGLVRALFDLQKLVGGGRDSAARKARLSLVA